MSNTNQRGGTKDMTITTENETKAHYSTIKVGDRVRLIDAHGDSGSRVQIGDEGVVTERGEFEPYLLRVIFDNGGMTQRYAYRFELVPERITVEDREGLDALPIGTVLRVGADQSVTVRKATEDRYPWATGTLAGDLDWGANVNMMLSKNWQPVTIDNPEILGEFTEYVAVPKVGDIVEIVGFPSFLETEKFSKWLGLHGVVTDAGDATAHIKPFSDRPDSFGRSPFFWETEYLRVVSEEENSTRLLKVGEQVSNAGQLDVLPYGSVVYVTDDPQSPSVKVESGEWFRFNRFLEGHNLETGPLWQGVDNETDYLRDHATSGDVIVAHVVASPLGN